MVRAYMYEMYASNINIYQVHKLRQVFLGKEGKHAKTRVGGDKVVNNPTRQNLEALVFQN